MGKLDATGAVWMAASSELSRTSAANATRRETDEPKVNTTVQTSFAMMGGLVPSVVAAPPQAAAKASTLYTQLDGYDGLAAVSDDFITALATDPTLSKSFTGLNEDRAQRTAHHRCRVEHVGTAPGQHVEQVQGTGAAESGDGSDQRAERRHRRAVRQLSVVSCQLAVVSIADAAGFLAT